MSVATEEWRHTRRLLAETDLRATLRRASVAADLVTLLGATLIAIAAQELTASMLGMEVAPFSFQWPLAIPFMAVLGCFYSAGLYERDAYMSRPLHAWTIVRASALAFVISAAAAFLTDPSRFEEPRLIPVLTFALFIPLDLLLRLGFLDRLYVSWIRRSRPVGFVVGDSPESWLIAKRLSGLRGFAEVRIIDVTGSAPGIDNVALELNRQASRDLPADAIFVDSRRLPPRDATDIIDTAQARGVDVYVVSGLLEPLEGSTLLTRLFQVPVTRVRRTVVQRPTYALKRTLDVAGSGAMLLLLSPVIAVLAAIIKMTSDGPVFYAQTRIGQSGKTFQFLKLRSMSAGSDFTSHQEYVQSLIKGRAKPMATDADGTGVFKLVDDPRITPIGRFIRKYSLDEIPQLWNVLRGDMSLVGPRPCLSYEACEYDEWQRQRLEMQSGITGIWQVAGRSRVSFDEMILQDLMYARNMRLWVDLCLCFKTIPAALLGGGG